jgi:hypothetical protein
VFGKLPIGDNVLVASSVQNRVIYVHDACIKRVTGLLAPSRILHQHTFIRKVQKVTISRCRTALSQVAPFTTGHITFESIQQPVDDLILSIIKLNLSELMPKRIFTGYQCNLSLRPHRSESSIFKNFAQYAKNQINLLISSNKLCYKVRKLDHFK